MHDSQTKSKYSRLLDKVLGNYFDTDRLYEGFYNRHLKKTYARKETKKYSKLRKRIEEIENIDIRNIENLLLE